MKVHCLFEQSGTFKKAFQSLGYEAIDYDIRNDFSSTDVVCDLFKEIDRCYSGEASIFDSILPGDLVFAFFPCVRFVDQVNMSFRGISYSQKCWGYKEKLVYSMQLEKERSDNYYSFCRLALIALNKGFKMVVENPYSSQHYLVKYFPISASLIDYDRRLRGDWFKKPTQYWFFNFLPKYNVSHLFECDTFYLAKSVVDSSCVERSLISPEYALNFIKEFIL